MDQAFISALALVGVYAISTKVALPIYDFLARVRLHSQPKWAKLGAKKDGWALITGASTGMGREYALQLARKGLNVVIIADPPTATQLAEVKAQVLSESNNERKVIALSVDLLDASVYSNIFEEIKEICPNISVLVNNVGMCVLNRYDAASIELDTKMFTLNVVPMVRFTKHILPHMKAAKRGCIINMASLSGVIPTPFLAVYGATKSFVRKFNDSIREEVRKFNISVTVAMPFGVKTPLYDKIDQNTVGTERRDGLCVDPAPAVEHIIKKINSNREHYGHDLHDLIGAAMDFMPRQKASEEFRKALINSVPRPPGQTLSADDL